MLINLDEILLELKAITPKMTNEKLDYLKKETFISPIKQARLSFLKRKGASEELLARLEYSYRFEQYANKWYRTWKDIKWGELEGESLNDFANSALEQATESFNNQKSQKL